MYKVKYIVNIVSVIRPFIIHSKITSIVLHGMRLSVTWLCDILINVI